MRTHALAIACSLALASCAGPSKPPCTQESLNALRALYSHAARDVIESGACDGSARVEDCAEYRALELHFDLLAHGMCS